ncbi:L-lysine 6-monooxygenase (NADPH-requiring)-domain-containing protein [Xylogone sp. PMI_703]|nr:L-lysine 6-monooxygenase (NADPH-requiring)-domain-containing protein [Xylogone sp. PMI_703]
MPPSAISSPAEAVTDSPTNGYFQSGGRSQVNGHSTPLAVSTTETASSNGSPTPSTPVSSAGSSSSSVFPLVSQDDEVDLLCVGFGPANIAIGIALHDALKNPSNRISLSRTPKVLFLEKNPQFSWHAGMQIPGAKMQISFLKDLATPRDPTSRFTFLNYLKTVGRLNKFINLSTFTPSRVEFEDYLRWCASFFERQGCVRYNNEVISVTNGDRDLDGKVVNFLVTTKNTTGNVITRKAKNVVVAAGGRPNMPSVVQGIKHVYHSSRYMNEIKQIQKASRTSQELPEFVVIGGGQSAAEIFNDLWDRFPQSKVTLIVKASNLRPSDDSPFVNEIFDPDRVDGIYECSPAERAVALREDKATNYSVVRIDLLEHLYEKMYIQRLEDPDEQNWRCRILTSRNIDSAHEIVKGDRSNVLLKLSGTSRDQNSYNEEITANYIFSGTGYLRNAYEDLLKETKDLLPSNSKSERPYPVSRNYRVLYDEHKVHEKAGVWLQGCNEATHGLSDSLLSILAIRGGEMVQSIFF